MTNVTVLGMGYRFIPDSPLVEPVETVPTPGH